MLAVVTVALGQEELVDVEEYLDAGRRLLSSSTQTVPVTVPVTLSVSGTSVPMNASVNAAVSTNGTVGSNQLRDLAANEAAEKAQIETDKRNRVAIDNAVAAALTTITTDAQKMQNEAFEKLKLEVEESKEIADKSATEVSQKSVSAMSQKKLEMTAAYEQKVITKTNALSQAEAELKAQEGKTKAENARFVTEQKRLRAQLDEVRADAQAKMNAKVQELKKEYPDSFKDDEKRLQKLNTANDVLKDQLKDYDATKNKLQKAKDQLDGVPAARKAMVEELVAKLKQAGVLVEKSELAVAGAVEQVPAQQIADVKAAGALEIDALKANEQQLIKAEAQDAANLAAVQATIEAKATSLVQQSAKSDTAKLDVIQAKLDSDKAVEDALLMKNKEERKEITSLQTASTGVVKDAAAMAALKVTEEKLKERISHDKRKEERLVADSQSAMADMKRQQADAQAKLAKVNEIKSTPTGTAISDAKGAVLEAKAAASAKVSQVTQEENNKLASIAANAASEEASMAKKAEDDIRKAAADRKRQEESINESKSDAASKMATLLGKETPNVKVTASPVIPEGFLNALSKKEDNLVEQLVREVDGVLKYSVQMNMDVMRVEGAIEARIVRADGAFQAAAQAGSTYVTAKADSKRVEQGTKDLIEKMMAARKVIDEKTAAVARIHAQLAAVENIDEAKRIDGKLIEAEAVVLEVTEKRNVLSAEVGAAMDKTDAVFEARRSAKKVEWDAKMKLAEANTGMAQARSDKAHVHLSIAKKILGNVRTVKRDIERGLEVALRNNHMDVADSLQTLSAKVTKETIQRANRLFEDAEKIALDASVALVKVQSAEAVMRVNVMTGEEVIQKKLAKRMESLRQMQVEPKLTVAVVPMTQEKAAAIKAALKTEMTIAIHQVTLKSEGKPEKEVRDLVKNRLQNILQVRMKQLGPPEPPVTA